MRKTRSIIMLLLSFVVLLLLTSNVSAFDGTTQTWNGCPITRTENNNVVTWQLNRDAIGDTCMDLEVHEGQTVILDLNGHTLQNYSDGQKHEKEDTERGQCSTIWVKQGGTLTIKDTSTGEKKGKIEQATGSTNVPVVNDGTLVIEDVTITGITKKDNVGVVVNNGDLTIKSGTITGSNECVQNFGTATISGGEIKETGDFFAVRNEGTMTIAEGAKVESTSTKTSIVGNMKVNGKEEPSLTVSGATITGATAGVVNYNGEANLTGVDKVHLNGGKVTVDEKSTVTYGSGLVVKVGDTYYADNEETTDIKGETSATDIVKELKKNGKAKVTVVQGELALTGAATGFTVEKLGEGKVTVNGVEVINKYTVPAQENNEEEEEQDDTPNTGIDVYAVAGAILLVSALGVVVLNKRK